MSTIPRIYLDFNATTPLTVRARDAMLEVIAWLGGNPSSIHAEGRHARDVIERARNAVAGLMGRPREQIVFTSGGTESNALGVATLAAAVELRGLPRVVASSPIDHPSLLAAVNALAGRGWEVRAVPTAEPTRAIFDGVGLLATAVVNHELGTLLDARLIVAARAAGALVHLDAVQAAGKRALGSVDADALAISGHKIGGPQGVGAVALAIDGPVAAFGHQERGRRGGTENTIGIAGFGAAADAIGGPELWDVVADLGARLEAGILAIPDTRIHGGDVPRAGGTVNARFGGARGEAIVIALDLAGVAASTGAACTSGTVQPSPVLLALGLTPDEAREAVRFSLGRTTTRDEIDRVIGLLASIVERARHHRS